MSDSATLNSKLRVLIAKTFRAEKLYSSLRKPYANLSASPSSFSEVANDIRAKQWQKTHTKLRTELNDILDLKNGKDCLKRLTSLYNHFVDETDYCNNSLDSSLKELLKAANREEFVHSMKLSFELVRLKAKMQACFAITEELSQVLALQGIKAKSRPEDLPSVMFDSSKALGEELDDIPIEKTQGNVIQLKKKFS